MLWGVLLRRGKARARRAALATTGFLTAVFAWRATMSWLAVQSGQSEKLVAAVLITAMLIASLATMTVLLAWPGRRTGEVAARRRAVLQLTLAAGRSAPARSRSRRSRRGGSSRRRRCPSRQAHAALAAIVESIVLTPQTDGRVQATLQLNNEPAALVDGRLGAESASCGGAISTMEQTAVVIELSSVVSLVRGVSTADALVRVAQPRLVLRSA